MSGRIVGGLALQKEQLVEDARKRARERIKMVMMRGAEALGRFRTRASPYIMKQSHEMDGISLIWLAYGIDANGARNTTRTMWTGSVAEVQCDIEPSCGVAAYQQALVLAQWGTEIIVRRCAEVEAEYADESAREIAALEEIGSCVEHTDCEEHPSLACECDVYSRRRT